MKDRDVQFPNRYRVTKVEGTDDIYDFEPVPGEVTEDGSLVNKSLLFSDIAAGLFKLYEENATPNKAFEFLGKFNQHWWKRKSLKEQYGISVELVETGAIDYVQSSDRSAYPDSGEQGGYEYQYLGVPFENLPDMPKIEIGSYVGNGKYGKSNPNSLTFSFIPKFWGILASYEPGVPYDKFRAIPDRILLPWGETLKNPSSGNEEMVIPSYDGNKVSWYSNRGQDTQCSSNNYVYYYFAIA